MYANINGYKIFFDVEGLQFVPDGPVMREKPVCFVLHGGPRADHSHMLSVSPLSELMQLVYIDDRNCGRSEIIDPKTNSIKQNADDIEALRQYLGLEKIFILGQSYGGMKAMRYLIDHPEHLYGAVIACTTASADGLDTKRVAKHVAEWGTPEQYQIWTTNALQRGEISFMDYMEKMAPLYHGKGKFDLQATLVGNQRSLKNDDVIQYQMSGELASMDTFNMLPELTEVDLPCLVLCGERDFITDLEANYEIHKAIPNSEFYAVKDASHEIFEDFPQEVFPVITDFIKRVYR